MKYNWLNEMNFYMVTDSYRYIVPYENSSEILKDMCKLIDEVKPKLIFFFQFW